MGMRQINSHFLAVSSLFAVFSATAGKIFKVSQPQSLEVVFIRRPGGSYIIYIALGAFENNFM